MNQIAIIQGCKNGQESAFKSLVEQYAPKLMAICMRYLKDEDLAKDALQECLISIFRSINTYSGLGSFEAWISRIAVNACLKEIRSKNNLQSISLFENHEVSIDLSQDNLNVEDILKLVNDLSDMHRLVFNLNVVEGYNHQEIADMLNISESSSRVYLSRARKILQDKIEDTNNNNIAFTVNKKCK